MNKKRWIIGGIVVVLTIITVLSLYYIDIDAVIQEIENLPVFYMGFAFIGLISLQIVLAFLPGEPLELAAGYMFGSWLGTLICMLGSLIGTFIVYLLVKIFKRTIIDMMFQKEKVDEMTQLLSSKKSMKWMFIIFLIPGTPKDIMTYVASLGDIDLKLWLILTTIGRIPSIVTSTFLSDSLKNGQLFHAIIIFAVTIVFVIIGTLAYKKITSLHNRTLYISNKERDYGTYNFNSRR